MSTASGPSKERLSYTAWLKQQGVVGMREHSDSEKFLHEPAINYMFEHGTGPPKKDGFKGAEIFMANHHLAVPEYLNEQKVFPDSISNKPAIIITEKMHQLLQKEYQQYLKYHCKPRTEADIQEQLSAVENRLVANDKSSGWELSSVNRLASNQSEEGLSMRLANSAYQFSLRDYLALHRDQLDQSTVAKFNTLLSKDKSIGMLAALSKDAKLLEGGVGSGIRNFLVPKVEKIRRKILAEVKKNVSALLDGSPQSAKGKEKDATPRFYPDANGHSDVDEIYLCSGGQRGHFAVAKIWKVGCNEVGEPVEQGQKPALYRYYRTEYNAGAGANFAAAPFRNPATDKMTTGVVWAQSTREVVPLHGNKPVEERLRESLEEVMTAERMCMLYPNPAFEPKLSKKEKTDFYEWPGRFALCLGKRVDSLSAKGLPQKSGNCSLMSLMVASQEILGEGMAQEHWRYAKGATPEVTLQALKDKQKELKAELNRLKKEKQAEPKKEEPTLRSNQLLASRAASGPVLNPVANRAKAAIGKSPWKSVTQALSEAKVSPEHPPSLSLEQNKIAINRKLQAFDYKVKWLDSPQTSTVGEITTKTGGQIYLEKDDTLRSNAFNETAFREMLTCFRAINPNSSPVITLRDASQTNVDLAKKVCKELGLKDATINDKRVLEAPAPAFKGASPA